MAVYDREVCPGCRIHPAVADELGALTWEDRLCKTCRAAAVHERVLVAQDSDWNDRNPNPKPTTPRPADGRHSSLRVMTPEEVAEREARKRR